MKSTTPVSLSGNKISMCAFLAFACLESSALSQEGPALTSRGQEETQMDLPGSFHRYYGQNVTYYRDSERSVAKIDVDADLNYDGSISNEDPADGGAFENTPPGLVVGVGELSKLILRLRPYRIDYQGDVVVTIEITGINRGAKSGKFESFEQEKSSVGRLRVWKDANKKILLLDSGDSNKRTHEFIMDATNYPANLPGVVPRTLFVEGVSVSGAYAGDLRLLTTVSHREHGTTPQSYAEDRKKWLKSFRTSFDHMLFTVKARPMEKQFVNNNAEGVWIKP
jgi:hypothetical protein